MGLTVQEFQDWYLNKSSGDTSIPEGFEEFDVNKDGGINVLDLQTYANMINRGVTPFLNFPDDPSNADITKVSGVQNM